MFFLRILVEIRGPLGSANAPRSSGPLPDVAFSQGSGPQIIETAFNFSGSNLKFSLESGEGIASINELNGIVTIDTRNIIDDIYITVKAENEKGSTRSGFGLSIYPTGIGYWKIEEDFIVG